MSILICYDGSPSAKHALAVASKTLRGDQATLLHVWDPPVAALADSFCDRGVPGLSLEELEQASVERAKRIAREGEELASEAGLAVQARVKRAAGPEYRTILDVADAINAELIVVGTRGHAATEPSLLASVSAALMDHSERPVLVVPARAD